MGAFDPWLADAFDAARELHTPDSITELVDLLGGRGRGGGVKALAGAMQVSQRTVERWINYELGTGRQSRKPSAKVIKQARAVLPVRAKVMREIVEINRPLAMDLVIYGGSIQVSNEKKPRKRPPMEVHLSADDLAEFWDTILPEQTGDTPTPDTTALLDVAYGRIPTEAGTTFEEAVIRAYCGQDGLFTEIEDVEGLNFE